MDDEKAQSAEAQAEEQVKPDQPSSEAEDRRFTEKQLEEIAEEYANRKHSKLAKQLAGFERHSVR